MKLTSASLILAATVLGACATTEPPHVNEWIQKPQTNHLYMALKTDTALNWQDASDVAEVLFVCGSSSHLATIQTQDEDKFIMDSVIAESDENFWIGGVKKTGPNGEREWDWGNGYGDGWEWITAGDIPDNQDRNDSGEQTSGVDGDGNYENWHDPFEPSNSYGAGQENCLEIKGFDALSRLGTTFLAVKSAALVLYKQRSSRTPPFTLANVTQVSSTLTMLQANAINSKMPTRLVWRLTTLGDR